ncbi:MAG: FHA domain-containing protein, partial [Persicimonas sp.]
FAEPAVLAVFKLGEQLGEIAIDADCTVLGLDEGAPDLASDDEAPEELDLADMEAIEPVEDEADEVAYELELVEEEDDSSDEVAFSDDFGHDQEFQAEDAADEFDFDGQDAASDAFDEDTPVAEMSEASDVSEVSVASEAYEEPADVEEGPVVDLAQFGDASAFASRHGYVFRQNKNYTLYITSDAGTQLNDEVLTLGEHRKLADGDVIVLGGEVALRFDEPAA